jgi:hypothetical protein
MRNLRKYFLLLLSALPVLALAQESTEEHIDWSPARKLDWKDFKSQPDPASDAAASTTTYLGIEYSLIDDVIYYKIACRFSPVKSWGIHKTDYILGHEQGHFDIAEIFARKLHKRISEYSFNKNSYKQDLRKIYLEVMSEKEKWQNAYDAETEHSIRRKEQKEWLVRINNELENHKDYANYQHSLPYNQTMNVSIRQKNTEPNAAKKRRSK